MAMQLDIHGHAAWAYTGGKAFNPTLPVVVFIHGAEHDHSVWALQSRYLAHHGRAVLAVDLPGRRSPASRRWLIGWSRCSMLQVSPRRRWSDTAWDR